MAIRKQLLELYGEFPQMSRKELLSKIHRIKGNNWLRDQAFLCCLYLTGCRVEELVKFVKEKREGKYRPKKNMRGEVIGEKWVAGYNKSTMIAEPYKKNQIEEFPNHLMFNNLRCLKRRKLVPRNVPVPFLKADKEFIEILCTYLDKLGDDDALFPYTRQWAFKVATKAGLFCHFLRHIRFTYLVKYYHFTSEHLRKMAGWHDGRMASNYVHLDTEDLISMMLKERN